MVVILTYRKNIVARKAINRRLFWMTKYLSMVLGFVFSSVPNSRIEAISGFTFICFLYSIHAYIFKYTLFLTILPTNYLTVSIY